MLEVVTCSLINVRYFVGISCVGSESEITSASSRQSGNNKELGFHDSKSLECTATIQNILFIGDD